MTHSKKAPSASIVSVLPNNFNPSWNKIRLGWSTCRHPFFLNQRSSLCGGGAKKYRRKLVKRKWPHTAYTYHPPPTHHHHPIY